MDCFGISFQSPSMGLRYFKAHAHAGTNRASTFQSPSMGLRYFKLSAHDPATDEQQVSIPFYGA